MNLVKLALTAATLCPVASYAVLGGAPAAVTASSAPVSLRSARQAALAPSTTSTPTASAYSVRESADANEVTIREYVLPSNVVFALTWQGSVRPDMKVLLGSYFPNFVWAGEARAHGTGPLIVRNTDLVIESGGRPGRFFGVAFLPRLAPANVRVEDLQ